MPVKSKDASERLEDDTLGNLAWNLRNRIQPTLGWRYNPPKRKLPKGYNAWYYDPARQEYVPSKRVGNDYLGFHYWYK